jgi:hypothetical protein
MQEASQLVANICSRREQSPPACCVPQRNCASLSASSPSGTGFQPVICDSHSLDGCATLGSTGGARLSQASILGDFHRRVSSQMILK